MGEFSSLPFRASGVEAYARPSLPDGLHHSKLRRWELVMGGLQAEQEPRPDLPTATLLPNPKGCEPHKEDLMFIPLGSIQGLARVATP